jgi:DNA-nicking Smr family endonuclease
MSKREGKWHRPLADWHLWAEVKRTVRPLRPEPEPPPEDKPLPIPEPVPLDVAPRIPGIPPKPSEPKRPEHIDKRGLEPRVKRRLGRGQITIDATIDLHGMRQDEARAALERFLPFRQARGDRTVLVITGKGRAGETIGSLPERGVLRSMLPLWLAAPTLAPLIAGWDAAAQGHGGQGAFYIRLKRLPKALF